MPALNNNWALRILDMVPEEKPEHMRIKCKECSYSAWFPVEGVSRWSAGELIQNALLHVPVDNRELLLTGWCADCWDRNMGAE